jgi:hypothetical protein
MDNGIKSMLDRMDDQLFGGIIEELAFTRTHEQQQTSPPAWKFWKSPETIWVVKGGQLSVATWVLDQMIKGLPAEKQATARQADVCKRVLPRIDVGIHRTTRSPHDS